MKKTYTEINKINKVQEANIEKTLCKLGEEVGELFQAVNVDIGIKKGDKKKVRDNVIEESADIIQLVFSMCNLYNISFSELNDALINKTLKWNKVYGKNKANSSNR